MGIYKALYLRHISELIDSTRNTIRYYHTRAVAVGLADGPSQLRAVIGKPKTMVSGLDSQLYQECAQTCSFWTVGLPRLGPCGACTGLEMQAAAKVFETKT